MEPRRERQPLLSYSSDEERPPLGAAGWAAGRRAVAGGTRGRAATKARGAAALMHQWPDHIISAVYNYWVMFLFMTIVLLVTYGLIMTFSVIPTSRFRHGRGLRHPKDSKIMNKQLKNVKSTMQQVYCPIIVNNHHKINLTQYEQHIKSLKREFPNFEYNLIILSNDTEINSALNNNDVAMKTVLNKNEATKDTVDDFTADKYFKTEKHILSIFLDNSPLHKTWKSMSSMIIPFLVRTVAIWEGGGIVFDLVAALEHTDRTERLNDEIVKVLADFTIQRLTCDTQEITVKVKNNINNIQDVIDDLENNEFTSIPQNNLSSEESEISQSPLYSRSLLSLPVLNKSTYYIPDKKENKVGIDKDSVINVLHNNIKLNNASKSETHITNKSEQLIHEDFANLSKIKTDLLPYILKVLFNTKSSDYRNVKIDHLQFTDNLTNDGNGLIEKTHNSKIIEKKRESISPYDHTDQYKNDLNVDIILMNKENKEEHSAKSTRFSVLDGKNKNVVSINTLSNGISKQTITKRLDDDINLVLDVEGYLMATKASCHAFVDQMFSTIRKNPKFDSPKKIIDHAMKLFCREKANHKCEGIRLLL